MGNKLVYERFTWFHERIQSDKYPNAGHLARHFEISRRTAQRDIAFMQDRLKAPLSYDREKAGYRYLDTSYELPTQWFSEENVMALALAVRLSSTVPDEKIKDDLCELLSRLLGGRENKRFCFEDVAGKISVKNIEYSRVNGNLFHGIVDALFRETPLAITYYSPHNDEHTSRVIIPLHLLHYMGSWHLVAFCTKRNGLRDFVLSRITSVSSSKEAAALPADLPPVKEYVRRNFGIMQGGKTFEVKLLFEQVVAGWVGEQVWHPLQEMAVRKDGRLLMRFPASDLREIKRRILAHGADVKVLAPKSLAGDVKKEIERMGKIY